MWGFRFFLTCLKVATMLALNYPALTLAAESTMTISNYTTTRDCRLKQLPPIDCRNVKYSPVDGSCNNALNPYAGTARTPLKRLLPPTHDDNAQAFRRSSSGNELPLARTVSNILNSGVGVTNRNSSVTNAMFVQFGQYMTHDFASTPTVEVDMGTCLCSNPDPRACINVPVASHDPHYDPSITCIPLKASKAVSGCDEGPTEQINSLSAYIDASTIYGSYQELTIKLRDPNSAGKLLLKNTESAISGCPIHRNKKILPFRRDFPEVTSKTFACPAHGNSPACFISGEERVNENIGLSSSHLLFAREHNRIAERMKILNPEWDDDTVFYESRRIVIAMHQIITYREFLPLLLGPKLMKEFDLGVLINGFYYGYDATYDATISNAFTTAAFRYGHSQVGSFFHRPSPDFDSSEAPSIRTFQALFDQSAVINGTSPAIMRGLVMDAAKLVDPDFVEDLRNRMFEGSQKPGEDLLAINIQRGRHHGLPTYNSFREFCGLRRAILWKDLSDVISNSILYKLKLIYENVDDVDLYVGGISETPLHGATVGPTFGCIIASQFRDLKKGDRYWFENPGIFNEEQLSEIRKVRLSRILCDNMEGMKMMPPSAMELQGESNTRVRCSALPQMKISSWKAHNHVQEGDWTRWLPCHNDTEDKVLMKILARDPDSVCRSPIKTEIAAISKLQPYRRKVRFLCPKGSINGGTFPNSKQNLMYYWTSWLDRDSPLDGDKDDIESLDLLRAERPDDICGFPIAMQARTKNHESAFHSKQVFAALNPRHGLVCRGADQEDGECRDYKVRFYCPIDYREEIESKKYYLNSDASKSNPSKRWTPWLNLGNPEKGFYDVETPNYARNRGFPVCRRPLLIEGRVANTTIPAERSGVVLKRFSVFHGLVCDNRDQEDGFCRDFEVRYLCRSSRIDLIGKT
ncbi:peroxidase mlt-7-like [Clavelina lepadiformis]|uniref:peroxidase mlt-7-like n=1 Tax=Clavelina lepadiformis TaxID=159417 RepID=UPI0040431013